MSTKTVVKLFVAALIALPSATAFAGRGSSGAAIAQAVESGSVDGIIAELERSEHLPCVGCIDTVMKLVDNPSAKVRDAAGWWLTRRGTRDEVLEAMQARFAGADPVAARNAADVLGAMRDPASVAGLGAYVKAPLDEESGKAAARALGNIGHPMAKQHLVGAFSSSLPGVRMAAVMAIRDLRAPIGKAVIMDASALAPLFADSDAGVRRQAAQTAGFLGDKAAVPALITMLKADASAPARKAAAWALGALGDTSARDALIAAQNDSDAFVRSIATAAAGRLR